MDCPEGSQEYFAADTLQRHDYLEYVRSLADAGFEIASHGATMEPSLRERTVHGFDFLKREFGSVPRLHANHGQNSENLYWGSERFRSPLIRQLIRLLGRQLEASPQVAASAKGSITTIENPSPSVGGYQRSS